MLIRSNASPASDVFAPEKSEKRFFLLLSLCFVLNALAAYAVGGVPLPWLSLAGLPLIAFSFFFNRAMPRVPGVGFLLLFLFYAFVLNVVGILQGKYSALMPELSTTSYSVFIFLRFLTIVSVLSLVMILWSLFSQGWEGRIKRFLIYLGCIISLMGLYIYAAQILGLPELSRTRVGTTGTAVQEVRFTYAFHRVLGTFREPSHLAEWLILPLFLALSEGRKRIFSQVLMSITLLMTGSLTGIGGVVIGLLGALIFFAPVSFNRVRTILAIVLLGGASLLITQRVILGIDEGRNPDGIVEVIQARTNEILEGGMGSTNRDYVYDYIRGTTPRFFGFGLGNANLVFGHQSYRAAGSSFLSLYFNLLYATGVPGIILFLGFIGTPVALALIHYRSFVRRRESFFYLAMYFAYCVVFGVAVEEISLTFGGIYAFLAYSAATSLSDPRRGTNSREVPE